MPKRVSVGERLAEDKKEAGGLFQSTKQARRIKATFYIKPELAHGLEAIQFKLWQDTGKKRGKSALVEEALELLIEKYGITE